MVNQQHGKRPSSPATLHRNLQTSAWSCGRGFFSPLNFSEKHFLWLLIHHLNCWNLTVFSLILYLAKKLTDHQNRMGFTKLKSAEALRIAWEESLPFSSSATVTHRPFRQTELPPLNPSGLKDQLQRLLQNRYSKELLTLWPKFCQRASWICSHTSAIPSA